MRQRGLAPAPLVARAVVHAAARVLPVEARRDWLREWEAELWYEAQRLASGAGGRWRALRLVVMAAGAWSDAAALRRHLPSRWESGMGNREWAALTFTGRILIMAQQVRQAYRSLLRSPGFSAVAVLTLALGIAANASLFTIIDAVVLEPLPYASADRVVVVRHPVPGISEDAEWGLSVRGYFHYQDNNRTLETLGAYYRASFTLAGDGPPQQLEATLASASLLQSLSARAHLGRVYGEDDDTPGATPVVLLSQDFWRARYGGRPDVVGRAIELNGGISAEVVGVLPAGFDLPDQKTDIWLPYRLDRTAPPVNSHFLWIIGRLKPGVTVAQASADFAELTSRLPEAIPQIYTPGFMTGTRIATRVTPLRDEVIGGIRSALWIVFGAVGLVLLIACANVANLFLVRTEARRREVAVRSALGGNTRTLAQVFYSESVLLAAVAGALALVLTFGGIRLLLALAPPTLPRLEAIGVDGSTVLFTALVSLAAGLLFGSFPLVRYRRGISMEALRDGGRGMTPGRSGQRARNFLVVGQVAMALVLLVGAGLMWQSFRRLRAVESGFQPRGVLAVNIALPSVRYQNNENVASFVQQLTARVGELGGVTAAGSAASLPLRDGLNCYAQWVDQGTDPSGAGVGCIGANFVGPGYFSTLGIRVAGQAFEPAHSDTRAGVVIVSRSLAARLWPDSDPIGRQIKPFGASPPFYRVIGVADDVRHEALDRPAPEVVYYPLVGMAGEPEWYLPRSPTLVVRADPSRAGALSAEIRRIAGSIDPTVPVALIEPLQDVVNRSLIRTSFTMLLLAIAAVVALLLGAVGIYGVISYVVSQRRAEIGLRMALGARVGQVRTLVLRQSLLLAGAGVLIGTFAAVGLSGVLRSLLFEVSPVDPLVYFAVGAALLVVAALASSAPAGRAARVDPMGTLRSE